MHAHRHAFLTETPPAGKQPVKDRAHQIAWRREGRSKTSTRRLTFKDNALEYCGRRYYVPIYQALQWEAADAEIKVSSDKNTEIKGSPFKA